jgi:tripartite-type tricarboxylate transporter receptor subunit TctC
MNKFFKQMGFSVGIVAVVTAATFAVSPVRAQSYPTRPINMVVPFPAGSATDTVARLIATKMAEKLGQQVVMENVPGAGGTIAAAKLARAQADGYNIMIHTTIALSAVLYKKLSYDTATAFEPIGLVNIGPYVLAANPAYTAKDAKELFANLKASGNKVAFANAGVGTGSHLCAIMLAQTLNAEPNLVPYKSTSLALQDVMAGHADILCDQTTNAFPHLTSKRIKAYAITSPQRNAAFPDIPTTSELGLPQVDVSVWHGLYAPKGTPSAMVNQLNAALQVALADPAIQKRLADMGTGMFAANQRSPAAHAKWLADELKSVRAVIEKTNLQID